MKAIAKVILLLVFSLLTASLVPNLAQAATKTYTLTVTKSGTGSGTVISSPAGINCGSTCSASFKGNTSVILTASASTGSTFQGWAGACTGTATTCTVTMSQAQNVTANFAPVLVNLTLAKTGTGSGAVASSPVGIDCGASCSASFNQFSTVTLTATASTGSAFDGWSGACAGTASTCMVTMNQAQTVSASFSLITETLTVSNSGSGTGNVSSLPIGINCGTNCSAAFNQFSTVMLAASASPGSSFDGWSGACSGTASTCNVTMIQAQTVTASFSLIPQTLTITNTGTGTGSVVSSPAGINCGATCSAGFTPDTLVTLTASPATGSTFTGWSGACAGTVSPCTVTMSQAQTVSANFSLITKTLTINNTGSGAGNITSSPAGINCGTTCSAGFPQNTVVTLTASPATGSTFSGWSGACTGTGTCAVTLSQNLTVNANFAAPAVTSYQYDPNGNLTQVTDPLGRIRQQQFDTLNQLVRQLEPHPTVIGSTQGQIDIGYDKLGQVSSITDPRNLTTNYNVDSLGNLLQQASPDTGITDASHDAAGNLNTHTDARGRTATYSYDSLNRISQITYDDQTITYTWDNCANGIGRLCGLTNSGGNISYGYDSHGRLTYKTQTAGATPLAVSHTYNAAGQRTGSVTPGGKSIEYQWTGGRITAILVNGQPLLTQVGYDPDGQVNGWLWGNNQPNERFYDKAGHAVIVSMGTDAATQQPDTRYYGYDAAGRQVTASDDLDPTLDQHHDYDELDRLTASQRGDAGQSRIDYSYDLNGNRSGKVLNNTSVYNYNTNASSNQLQSQSGTQTVNYSYDAAGNLISDGSRSYSYNAAGQRIAIVGQGISYGYDALGQRITKTVAGNTTQYFYDEQGRLTGEYTATGQLIQEIVWLGNLPVAVLKPAGATTDLYYIHADHLGTPRKITRPLDNKVLWTWESEAFGNSLPDQNPSGLGNFTFNLRFAGQYYDAETGLFYNMARYYNPQNGRYEQSDPIGLAGGVNTYTYVSNNPVNLIDPDGLEETGLNQICASNGQGTNCSTGMRPPPEGAPINGPLSPVGIAATAAEAGLAACPIGRGVGLSKSSDRLLWGSWKDYQKITANGREYAQVGDRLYTRHAVDRMQPGGLGTPAGGDGPGRSFSPNLINEVISNGLSRSVTVNGVERTIYSSGTAEVVTEQGGRIVITVNPFRGGQ